MARIVSIHKVAEFMNAIEVDSPEIVSSAQAGHIVLARLGLDAPWIPKAVIDPDRERGVMTLLVNGAIMDAGAEGMECELKGPFGSRKSLGKARKILFVAERDGIGAVLARAVEAKTAGLYTMVIAGYRTQSEIFWIDRLNSVSDELYVVTEDGSYGIKGPIRHTVRAVCEQTGDIDRVHAAGSLKLLKAVADVTRAFKLPATASLAAIFDDATPPISAFRTTGASPNSAPPADGEPSASPDPESSATSRESMFEHVPGADEAYDWEQAVDLDAHATDFDALARRFGILVTR